MNRKLKYWAEFSELGSGWRGLNFREALNLRTVKNQVPLNSSCIFSNVKYRSKPPFEEQLITSARLVHVK